MQKYKKKSANQQGVCENCVITEASANQFDPVCTCRNDEENTLSEIDSRQRKFTFFDFQPNVIALESRVYDMELIFY